MSKPNIPLESTPKIITRSQAKQDSQLAKIVDLNQTGSLKIKPLRNREYLADNKCQNIPGPIPTEKELDISIDTKRRLATNSALRKNKNMEYLKSDEQKNNRVTRLNVAREDKFVCLICKELGHTTEKCFHLSKAQEAVLNNKQQNFSYPNQQRYNNLNGQKSNNNNFSRNNYNNFPNNKFFKK